MITYTLLLTNTGSQADTYHLSTSDNSWPAAFPTEVGPLAPGSGTQVTITVSVPSKVAGGAADIAVLAVVSEGSHALVDLAELTTVVNWKVLFLPVIQR